MKLRTDNVLWFLAVVGVFHVGLYYGRPIGDALAAMGWLR